MELAALLLVGL